MLALLQRNYNREINKFVKYEINLLYSGSNYEIVRLAVLKKCPEATGPPSLSH